MCDYSLQLVASRSAKIGDKLVTTKFNNSHCARSKLLRFHDPPAYECLHPLGPIPAMKQ
jgi:hypothetical protein